MIVILYLRDGLGFLFVVHSTYHLCIVLGLKNIGIHKLLFHMVSRFQSSNSVPYKYSIEYIPYSYVT